MHKRAAARAPVGRFQRLNHLFNKERQRKAFSKMLRRKNSAIPHNGIQIDPGEAIRGSRLMKVMAPLSGELPDAGLEIRHKG
jgi:hypothetical protein